MKRGRARLFACAILALITQEVHPCAYDYHPVDFIVTGTGDRALYMPTADFLEELRTHFGTGELSEKSANPWYYHTKATQEAHLESLSAIIERSSLSPESAATVRNAYTNFVKAMRRPELANPQRRLTDRGTYESPVLPQDTYVPTAIENYPVLLRFLPKEFELYLRGAAQYHTEHYETAIAFWEELLALPTGARNHRTAWAAFMLGKAWQKLKSEKAIAYFESTRAFAAEGFPDPLGLATSSLGWQALSELRQGQFQPAITHYLEQFKSGSPNQQQDAFESLNTTCRKLFLTPEAIPSVAADASGRQVVSLWLISQNENSDNSRAWLQAMEMQPLDTPPVDAGRMAWIAYNGGDMALAQGWTALAADDDYAAKWVQAKLLMRDGKLADAAHVLDTLCDREMPAYALEQDDALWYAQDVRCKRPAADLGVMLLNQGKLEEAYVAFATGNYLDDAKCLGRFVLSLDEQQMVVERLDGSTPPPPHDEIRRLLRYGLATRMISAGRYGEAVPYFPQDSWTASYKESGMIDIQLSLGSAAERFATALETSKSSKVSPETRGELFLRAADIALGCGENLFETFYSPPSFEFVKAWRTDEGQRPARLDGVTEELEARLKRFVPPDLDSRPYRDFRYQTAELYWQAAKLLPDNDPRTARALWEGGKHLAPKDPKGADRFYKALVRRCRKLPIGQEADERRWFPPKPEDW